MTSWQDVATAVIVLTTLSYLAYRVFRRIRRKGFPTCGCCSQRPADPPEERLVKIGDSREKPR